MCQSWQSLPDNRRLNNKITFQRTCEGMGVLFPSSERTNLLTLFSAQQLHGLSYIEYLEDYTSIGSEGANEKKTHNQKILPKTLRTAVSKYLLSELLPLSTIENDSFRKLIKGIILFLIVLSRIIIHLSFRSDRHYWFR